MTDFDLGSEEAKLPSISGIEGITDPATKRVLQAVKEILEIRIGQRPKTSDLDKAVTFRDLYKYNIASFTVNGENISNPSPDTTVTPSPSTGGSDVFTEDDFVIPGAPLELIATGTNLSVLLEWDAGATSIAYTEIYRSEDDNVGNAILIGTTTATIYADILNEAGLTRYYWIRFVNPVGIAGNFNAIDGAVATTGQITSNEIISVDGAKIIDATILNAKIANVSADKITTGTLQVGQVINVGTSLNRIFIDGNGIIRSGGALDFMNGSGFWQGVTGGIAKWFVGNSSKYIAWDGANPFIQSNNLTLTDTDFIFTGSGTFNGDGNFTGTLNVNNQFIVDPEGHAILNSAEVKGAIYADSGYFGGELLAGVIDFTKLAGIKQVYLSPGTYTITVPSDGKNTMRVSISGGSGGGGGGKSSGGYAGGGGGGGAADATVITFTALVAGATYTLIIGPRGLGGAVNGNGTNGGGSSIIGLVTATGGAGGGVGGVADVGGIGGAGGNGGENGQDGFGGYTKTIGNAVVRYGGIGGNGGVSLNGKSGGKGGKGGSLSNFATAGEDGENGFALIEFFNPNTVVLKTEYNELISLLQSQGITTP